MIFTHIEIDNLFSFRRTALDLSYPRQIKDSTIANEFLMDRPRFCVRKVCILSGTNASGKTSLGKILNMVQNFVVRNVDSLEKLQHCIHNKQEAATLTVEFATLASYRLHRLQFVFSPKQSQVEFEYARVAIGKNDSVAMTRKRLDHLWESKVATKNTCYLSSRGGVKYPVALSELFDELKADTQCGWFYVFSNNELSQTAGNAPNTQMIDKGVLKAVLQTFDKSIADVLESRDDDGMNGYTIKFSNGDTALMDLQGKIVNHERLSKGTYDAIIVAEFVSRVMNDQQYNIGSDTYFLDEKMAFAHSDLEQAIINLIIEKLHSNSQFFYTTHNYDILEMNLPIHSYVFLKKHSEYSEFVQPEASFKKNDRKLLNHVKNDVFCTLPDTSAIDGLL